MKKHFHEQLIETYRVYDTYDKGNGKPGYRDIEDAPLHEGMNERYGWGKTQTDNLNPLRKFIAKNVGRPWDKVYSEICAQNDQRNISQYHLRSHVKDMIELNVVMIAGVPYHAESRFGDQSPIYRNWNGGYYVHPKTGLICQAKQDKKYKRKPNEVTYIDLGDGLSYQKINGEWHRVKTERMPARYGIAFGERVIEKRSRVSAYMAARIQKLSQHKKRK